jgi:uncharacterized protein YjbJ (UPF0337 family)
MSDEMSRQRMEGMYEEGKGTLREGWGKVSGQPDQELKGQLEQAMGQVKQFVAGVTESLGTAVRQVREDPSMTHAETRKAALKLLAYIAGALVVVNEILRAPKRRQ